MGPRSGRRARLCDSEERGKRHGVPLCRGRGLLRDGRPRRRVLGEFDFFDFFDDALHSGALPKPALGSLLRRRLQGSEHHIRVRRLERHPRHDGEVQRDGLFRRRRRGGREQRRLSRAERRDSGPDDAAAGSASASAPSCHHQRDRGERNDLRGRHRRAAAEPSSGSGAGWDPGADAGSSRRRRQRNDDDEYNNADADADADGDSGGDKPNGSPDAPADDASPSRERHFD